MSLMPFKGRCVHCGHDHGNDFFQPSAELEAAKAEITQLKVKPLHYEYDHVVKMQHEWLQQLAARDLVIREMRESLNDVSGVLFGSQSGFDHDAFLAAVALQPTTEALDAYVAEAVKAEREACAAICDEHADDPVYCGSAIRARSEK